MSEIQLQDESTRDKLAKWARELEVKAAGLQKRESLISQQESSMARNHNLLQL